MTNIILGQLRNAKRKVISARTGTIVKVPFSVVDYAEHCRGLIPHGYLVAERVVPNYTAYFNISVATLSGQSRVDIPFEVSVRVNGRITGSIKAGLNYFGSNRATGYSGEIPVNAPLAWETR